MRKAIILAAFFCAACSNYSTNLPSIKPYKMDIQQGNVVTSKMMLQLRPGMSRAQVRFIMGTPLIADSFHANRWDYLYRMQKDGKLIEQRHVILDFENDKLKGVRGDVIPAGTGEASGTEAPAKPAAAKKKEKSLVDKLKFWKDDEEQAPAKVESRPELMPEPQPAPAQAQTPAPVPPPAPQATPAPAPAAAESIKRPEPAPVAAQPAPVPEPPKQPAAEAVPAPKAPESAPAAPVVKTEAAKVKPETVPADDLPPEDAPGYFERMLEKIGF